MLFGHCCEYLHWENLMVMEKQRRACCTSTGSNSLWPWKHDWCPDFFGAFSDFLVKCCNLFHFKSFIQEHPIAYNDKAVRSPDTCCSEASWFEENPLQPISGSRQFLLKHVENLPWHQQKQNQKMCPQSASALWSLLSNYTWIIEQAQTCCYLKHILSA